MPRSRPDLEARETGVRNCGRHVDLLDVGAGRAFVEPGHEHIDHAGRALGKYFDPTADQVPDPSRQAQIGRPFLGRDTEEHALDPAAHLDPYRLQIWHEGHQNVLRRPITDRRIAVPQRRHGSSSRP